MRTKSRSFRRRGKARRLKYSWKSAGHPSVWKRIADGKNQSRKQYIPCGCQSTCGKQCSCLQNGTCCEKYCGYVGYVSNVINCPCKEMHRSDAKMLRNRNNSLNNNNNNNNDNNKSM